MNASARGIIVALAVALPVHVLVILSSGIATLILIVDEYGYYVAAS